MKRFLSKNTIKIFTALIFVGFSSSFIKPSAKSKLDYYKELFGKEFGFTVYESDKKTAEKKDYFSSNPEKGYSIFLTSSFEKQDVEKTEKPKEMGGETEKVEVQDQSISTDSDDLFGVSKVILICDKEFSGNHPFSFYCDDSTFSSNEALNLEVFLRGDQDSGVDIYIIPENTILSPDGRSDLTAYFKAVKRSDKALKTVEDASEDASVKEEGSSDISEIKKLKDSMVFEFFTLALSMFFIATLSWNLLRFFILKKRKIDFNLVRDILGSPKNLSLYQKIILPIIILLSVLYIPLVFSVSLRDGKGVDPKYLISYTKGTLSISKLVEFYQNGNFVRIAFFGYLIFIFSLLFIFFMPLFLKALGRFWTKISDSKINENFYKYSIPVLILSSILTSSFIGTSNSIGFLIFTLVLLFGILIKLSFDKEFNLNYSKKEKITLVLASFLILFSGIFFKFNKKDEVLDYNYEDLIGVIDEVVFLPYSKQLGEDTLMKEYKLSGSDPVFVDQYLVYSPIHSRIENKSASKFKNEGSFYIQNGDVEDIVKTVNKNKELFDVMVSESPSNFFRIKNPRLVSDEDVKIEITFSCAKQFVGTDKIKADFYYVSSDGKIADDNKTLFYYPGCLKHGEPDTLSVDFDYPHSDSEYIYVRLVDVLPSDIDSVRIVGKDLVIEPEYISKNEEYSVIDSGGLTTSAIVPITNYIFGDTYELSFDLSLDEDGKFDMSQPINELIKEGELENRFLIWSTKKYLPVRLPN